MKDENAKKNVVSYPFVLSRYDIKTHDPVDK